VIGNTRVDFSLFSQLPSFPDHCLRVSADSSTNASICSLKRHFLQFCSDTQSKPRLRLLAWRVWQGYALSADTPGVHANAATYRFHSLSRSTRRWKRQIDQIERP